MRKQAIRAATALPLMCCIGFPSAIHAEPAGDRPLSANCKQAWAMSESRSMTVPKILCREEDVYDDAIDRFMRETEVSPPPVNAAPPAPAPTRRPKPKFPRGSKAERHRTTKPEKTAREKSTKTHSAGKNHFAARHQAHGKKLPERKGVATGQRQSAYTGQRRTESARRKLQRERAAAFAAALRALHLGVDLDDLTPKQRLEVRSVLESLLGRQVTIAFLNALMHAEAGGPLVVVGGLYGKSADCQRRIKKLNFKGHPKEQNLPNRCFLRTRKYGLSTAAGSWQIVYYRNWRGLRQLLKLEDFTERNQAVAALELVRGSAVRGGQVGEGLVALLRNDLDSAISKGTDPWASSPYSRWGGAKHMRLLQDARDELAKLRNQEYAQKQHKRFGVRPTPETLAYLSGDR